KTEFDPIHVTLSENVIAGLYSIGLLGTVTKPLLPEESAALSLRLPTLLAWREQGKLYASHHQFLVAHPRSSSSGTNSGAKPIPAPSKSRSSFKAAICWPG